MGQEQVVVLLLFGLPALLKRCQCINGVWSTPVKCFVDRWCWDINATSHIHTHTCTPSYTAVVWMPIFISPEVYLCVHVSVCLWVCTLQFQSSLCVTAGLRLESRCNFPCTKTPTSGTRGERSILQVQVASLPCTAESYRLSWPVTRHSPCVSVCVEGGSEVLELPHGVSFIV